MLGERVVQPDLVVHTLPYRGHEVDGGDDARPCRLERRLVVLVLSTGLIYKRDLWRKVTKMRLFIFRKLLPSNDLITLMNYCHSKFFRPRHSTFIMYATEEV